MVCGFWLGLDVFGDRGPPTVQQDVGQSSVQRAQGPKDSV